ncbi:MAG: GspH/FimT family pseudopilin [Dokdonella sp.]
MKSAANNRSRARGCSQTAARDENRRLGGFTLIELLVVVVISAVLVAALTLAVGGTPERQLANTSERFQALLGQACSQAELSGREIGTVIGTDGYTFSRLDGDAWRVLAKGGELRPRAWPAGVRIELSREGRPLELAAPGHDLPQLVCFSSGELTPFALTLALGDAPMRYRITGADDGSLKAERIEGPP